jgi:hypothetical protein
MGPLKNAYRQTQCRRREGNNYSPGEDCTDTPRRKGNFSLMAVTMVTLYSLLMEKMSFTAS